MPLCPGPCPLQNRNGSDYYTNAKNPQAVDLRICHSVGLTLHNPNTLTADGPEIRIKPVGTRRESVGGDR